MGGHSFRCTLVVFGGRWASLDYGGSGFLSHFLCRLVVPTLFLCQVSLLVTCFGESAGRDGGRRPTQACRNLFRKGCFPHPVGRPRPVTVPFRPFEPRQIPPSLLREGLDGEVASTGRPAESPGKAFQNDSVEEAIAKHIRGGGNGMHLPSDPPLLPSCLRVVATVLSPLLCRKTGAHLVASLP